MSTRGARAGALGLLGLLGTSLTTLAVFGGQPLLQPSPPPTFPSAFFPPGIPPHLLPTGIPLPLGAPPRWPGQPPVPQPTTTATAPHRTIQAHLLRPEASLLDSQDRADHLRGVTRAATSQSPESTALLLELWTGRSRVLKDAEVMVAFTRGLARRRSEPRVRDALASILTTWSPADASQAAHARIARSTAAIALAQDGSDESIRVLFAAADRETTEDIATSALLRFPPRKKPSVFQLTPRTLRLLETLGDLRFADEILDATSSPRPEVRAAALHASALVPDTRAAEVARRALTETSSIVRTEATFALLRLHAKDGQALVTNLLRDETTATRGAALASLVETDGMARILREAIAKHRDPEVRMEALQTLARMRVAEATPAILSALAFSELRSAATRALAFSEAPDAVKRIEDLAYGRNLQGLAASTAMRTAMQAYALRLLAFGSKERSSSMDDAAHAAAEKPGHEAEAPAWFVLAISGKGPQNASDAKPFTTKASAPARRAFASGLAVVPHSNDGFVKAWLGAERDEKTLRVLVAAALSHPRTALLLSRKDTFDRAVGMGPEAALAARVWVSEATEEHGEEATVASWLRAPSANLRAATAQGLRSGKLKSAVGMLGAAYDAESDFEVRAAILTSLTALLRAKERDPGAATRELLTDIAVYDPDPAARGLADTALRLSEGGHKVAETPSSPTFATLISLKESSTMPLGLYVGPGSVFRVVPFVNGEAIVGGIPDRPGRLNLAVELP